MKRSYILTIDMPDDVETSQLRLYVSARIPSVRGSAPNFVALPTHKLCELDHEMSRWVAKEVC